VVPAARRGGGLTSGDGIRPDTLRGLLAARALRVFSYGAVSVVLGLVLLDRGLSPAAIGAIFTATLLTGSVTATVVGAVADRWGRRRWLMASSLMMSAGGLIVLLGGEPLVLAAGAALGGLSPSGYELGAFRSLEEAAIGDVRRGRVRLYSWYNLVGTLGGAVGALFAAGAAVAVEVTGFRLTGGEVVLVAFTAGGLALGGIYLLTPGLDSPAPDGIDAPSARLGTSRGAVLKLTALFGVDALAGGFVVQSLVALWFNQRFGLEAGVLGPIFFATNTLSALSYLVAARIAERLGLLATMVLTHLPSNLLLALVPFMPTWQLAAATLIARHALSQMDVPARQAYTMTLVTPAERSAAAGLTNAVRPAAASLAPILSGLAFQVAAAGLPFIAAGAIKAAYDVALWLTFRRVPLREDTPIGKP
jgi:MFS family permease